MSMQSIHAIKVFIVGDSHIVRSGLRKIIETQGTARVLGEVSVRQASADTIAGHNPDLVIVDLDPRSTDPLGFIGAFHEALDNIPVLVLGDLADHGLIQKALALGAAEVVLRMQPPAVLIAAIRELCPAYRDDLAGRTVTGTMVNTTIPKVRTLMRPSADDMNRIDSLTVREREIIRLIGLGLKNKDIAKRLSLPDITVRHHLTSIFRKLEVSDRQKLLILAHRYGLAELTLHTGLA